MKLVYTDQKINRSVPENVGVRLCIGTGLAILGIIMVLGAFSEERFAVGLWVALGGIVAAGAAYLVIFFAIRTIIVIRSTRARTPEETLIFDESKPYYSAQCPGCGVMIDYQRSDLAYRLWFRKGYAECPCCQKPIRHDAEKNRFIPHRYPEK